MAGYEARAEAIGEQIKAGNGGTMPTVSVGRFLDGPTRLYQPTSYSGVVLADVGVARPASQQDPKELITEIGPELIDQADADYVFVCTYGDPSTTQQCAPAARRHRRGDRRRPRALTPPATTQPYPERPTGDAGRAFGSCVCGREGGGSPAASPHGR